MIPNIIIYITTIKHVEVMLGVNFLCFLQYKLHWEFVSVRSRIKANHQAGTTVPFDAELDLSLLQRGGSVFFPVPTRTLMQHGHAAASSLEAACESQQRHPHPS